MGQNGRQETFEKDFLAITDSCSIHPTETYPSVEKVAEKRKNMKIRTYEFKCVKYTTPQ